jgi:primosomal replication protein N
MELRAARAVFAVGREVVMSVSGNSPGRRRSGLNNVNMSGCLTSRPKVIYHDGAPECRFWVCDDREVREAKFAVEAVARGERGLFLADRLRVGSRVAITGMLQAFAVRVAGGEIFDYELVVSHADSGDPQGGKSVERGGINAFTLSGVVTREPQITGLPGRDKCVFWMCDGDSEEDSALRLPVYLPPGKVTELSAELAVGDRLAVAGYLRSRKRFVSGSPVYECQMVGCHVDCGFLVEGGG